MCCAETAIAGLKCNQDAASKERNSALAKVEALRTALRKAQTDLDAAQKLQSSDQQQPRAGVIYFGAGIRIHVSEAVPTYCFF